MSEVWCWNQRSDRGLMPAGTYVLKVNWSGAEGKATIQTTGVAPTSTSSTISEYHLLPC